MNRWPVATGRHWTGWHVLTRPIPTSAGISCRRFMSRYGAAWQISTNAAPCVPGSIAWLTMWQRRTSIRHRRINSRTFVSLDVLDSESRGEDAEFAANRRIALDRLLVLIQKLNPLDRQVILLYLEGMDGASIGEITGISSGNVATKIHRIKNVIARRFQEGGRHGE